MAEVTSISSLAWANYTLYEALPRMAARGFERIEIASFNEYCFHFNFGSPAPKELRRMLDRFGMTPVCLNYFPGFHDAWEPSQIDECVRQYERKIEQLGEAGIPMMTANFSVRNARADQEYQLSNAVKAYDRIGEIGRTRGVRILLEVPHLYTIMSGVRESLWVFERLSSDNVGALIDSSHWGIIGYDLPAFVSALGSRLWHVHLRDSAGPDTADRRQRLELTPGSGMVDFNGFSAVLDDAGYSADVSAEFEYRDMTLEAIDREYDIGLRHLRKSGWRLPAGVRAGRSNEA